jgi:OOP family OmpA-OmpF porin
MNTTSGVRAATLGISAALALGLSAASADDFEESYWYALGDPTVPDGQLWTTSYGECWDSAYPDGPDNLPPCERAVPQSITVNVEFEFDKFGIDEVVNPSVLTQIDEYIESVKETPQDEFVTVVGHTDAKGSDEYNMELGLRRAETIRNYIIAQGYPADQVAPAESRGKRELLPDFSPFSFEQRRVVITKTDE